MIAYHQPVVIAGPSEMGGASHIGCTRNGLPRCLNAALRFGENVRADFPDLMLNVNVREYLDGEEREEIFAKLNNESSLREYAEHIDEFI